MTWKSNLLTCQADSGKSEDGRGIAGEDRNAAEEEVTESIDWLAKNQKADRWGVCCAEDKFGTVGMKYQH
jgi:hypothetical protein